MPHLLTKLVLGYRKSLPLSVAEFEEIRSARGRLLEGFYIEQKFALLLRNYRELELNFLRASLDQTLGALLTWDSFAEHNIETNRHFANFLSTTRLYKDHLFHHANLILPEGKKAVEGLRKFDSNLYDSSLGYRVIEALRNYVQHRGLPVHSLAFNAQRIGEIEKPAEALRYTLGVYASIDELAEDGKFKAPVLDELKKHGEIDLKLFMRDGMNQLLLLQNQAREMTTSTLDRDRDLLKGWMDRFREEVDSALIGLHAVNRQANGISSEKYPLLLEFDNFRRALISSSSHIPDLTLAVVSSERIKGKN